MAKSFSLALDDLFKMDGSLADLDAAVHEKYSRPALPCLCRRNERPSDDLHRKQVVNTRNTELEALEARLRATEERLKLAANKPMRGNSGRTSPHPRAPLGDTFAPPSAPPPPPPTKFAPDVPDSPARSAHGQEHASGPQSPTLRRPQDPNYTSSGGRAGAMPPTPGTSEGG